MILAPTALRLTATSDDSSTSSSSRSAYAKGYGVIVGSDGIEYIHSSTGSYYRADNPRWETWRADLGHSSIAERSAPADVLAIWDRQRGVVASPTAPPTTTPGVTTPPAVAVGPMAPIILIAGAGPNDGTMNVDRQPSSGAPVNTGIVPPTSGPTGNKMPTSTTPLTVSSRINWPLVIAATLGLGALLWFVGGRRRKGGS